MEIRARVSPPRQGTEMTARPKNNAPTVNLGRRGRDEVWTPRACGGDHRKLVRAGLADTVDQHRAALNKLAKV